MEIKSYIKKYTSTLKEDFGTFEFADKEHSPLHVPVVHPTYDDEEKMLPAFQIINTFFDKAFEKYHELFAFGEDVGKIGDVNQGLAGLQAKYGEELSLTHI